MFPSSLVALLFAVPAPWGVLVANHPAAVPGRPAPPLVIRDTYPRNPNVDVRHYRFELALSDVSDVIEGRATLDVQFRGPAERLRLDLVRADGRNDGSGMTVANVADGSGTALPFRHADDVLWVDLPGTVMAGTQLQVTVAYSGSPATGLRIGPNRYGDRTFFSDNWPNRARHWLPTVDHPYDKATSEFVVVAPARYQVISNGLLVEETDRGDGTRLTHWRHGVPIATWLYALGVAEFAVQHLDPFKGKPVQTWVYRQDRDAGFYDFAVPTHHALRFFDDRIGPFAYEKLANVQSASVGGGMEAATAIFYGENSVTGQRTERWRNVIIHEIAHQWWGNAVTETDWDDVWLSEGFATYFTLLFIEHAYGRDEFVRGLRTARERVRAFHADRPDYRIVHDNLDDMSQVTTSQIYQKGAWVLHMLRALVGDGAFWSGMREYYRRYQNGNATTDDFRHEMEQASGTDLRAFFEQWLYRGGLPELAVDWRYRDGTVDIEIRQVQAGAPFNFPLTVAFSNEEGSRHTFMITEQVHQFSLRSDRSPTRLDLDPEVIALFDAAVTRRD